MFSILCEITVYSAILKKTQTIVVKMAPTVKITSETLEKKIIQNGNGHVIKLYRSNKPLLKQHTKLIMKDAAILGFETFGFQLGQRNNIMILASATMCLFPNEFPSMNMLIPIHGRNSSLYNAALYRLKLERKKQTETEENPDELPKTSDEQEKTIEEHLDFLESANSKERSSIELSLSKTWDHRQNLMKDPETNIRSLIYNFLIADVHYIDYEYSLLLKKKSEKQKVIENMDFFKTLTMNVLVHIDPTLKTYQFDVPDEIKPFFGLIKLIGYSTARNKRNSSNNADNFQGACSRLIEFCNTNSPDSEALENDNTQPYLLGKYDTSVKDIKQYFIIHESHVIPLDPKFTFIKCFDLLFKIFNIFDLHYPSSLSHFYLFFDEFCYGLGKNDIPSNCLLYHKLMKTLDTFANEPEPKDNNEDENMECSPPAVAENIEIETTQIEDFSDSDSDTDSE